MKLRRLTNTEYDHAISQLEMVGRDPDKCPTCGSVPYELTAGVYDRKNGTYRYRGEEHQCNCEEQIKLQMHYALAHIGSQFMRFDWDLEYAGPDHIKEDVANYITRWDSFRDNGMGVVFYSETTGTGKTAAACHIGKTLIKQGEKVFFSQFTTLVSELARPESRDYERRLLGATLLIIDDILPAVSIPQQQLFAHKLEEVIRERTNWDLPTITTTNLTLATISEDYPRIHSLLAPKQQQVFMNGFDARISAVRDKNEALVIAKEIKPIV